LRLDWDSLTGLRVTIMGLGLHGGGAAAAAFFAKHGAVVTVTDLRKEEELAASIEKLDPFPIHYVLGRHDFLDFESADLVLKNPAVSAASPYLKAARRVETDISVFLSLADNPLIAVTGTKGKSTTASAIYHVLAQLEPGSRLGGNITVSPLTFVDELRGVEPSPSVVLELSSWQLADLRGKNLLAPKAAVVTNILPDHLNRYATMQEYVADKAVIVEGQGPNDYTICNLDDPYSTRFSSATRAQLRYFSKHPLPERLDGAWIDEDSRRGLVRSRGKVEQILPEVLGLPGSHNRLNLLAAGLALHSAGIATELIRDALGSFSGIRHRLELVAEIDGRRYYNDSTATIPEAAVAAIGSFDEPVVLIAGGTDKALDFAPFREFVRKPKCVVLLAGSATEKLVKVLASEGIDSVGPFESIDEALLEAVKKSQRGDVIVLSPGCASFEMFKNEFDRGDCYVRAVMQLGAAESL